MINTIKLKTKVKGEGTPLILVPGGLTGWKSWEPFVDLFVQKHRKVICVQLLNVDAANENYPLPEDYSLKTESGALNSAIDSLEILEPVDIVAWSYGAMTSLDFSLDHPEKVRTLTLIEPPAIWVLRRNGSLDKETTGTLNFFLTLRGDIKDDMLASFLQKAGFTSDGQSPRELPQWEQWLPFKQSLRNSPAVVEHDDKLFRLQHFDKPVLLVKGSGSAPFLHKIIDVLDSSLPDSRVIELPGGHAPHLVSNDKFMIELDNFHKNYIST